MDLRSTQHDSLPKVIICTIIAVSVRQLLTTQRVVKVIDIDFELLIQSQTESKLYHILYVRTLFT